MYTSTTFMERIGGVEYKIGNRNFNFKFSYVMGILNITPDSFSDGGNYIKSEKAVEHAIEMINYGADIIDIGGESTRPGSDPVSEEEELRRIIPVIKKILKEKPEAIISIDTTKASVAEETLRNGTVLINDISGGTFDPNMFEIVSKYNAAMVIMHIKGEPKTMQVSPEYSDVVAEVYEHLRQQSLNALEHGIDKIIIDPGIGFGKRLEDNLILIRNLNRFISLNFPVLIGLSRKSFIGNILNIPVDERDGATNAINMFALCNGARIIRTHNVKLGVQTSKLFNRIIFS